MVGDIAPSRLAPGQLELGRTLGRRVSLVNYGKDELRKHSASREHFLGSIMAQPKFWLYGSEAQLTTPHGKRTRQPGRRKAA